MLSLTRNDLPGFSNSGSGVKLEIHSFDLSSFYFVCLILVIVNASVDADASCLNTWCSRLSFIPIRNKSRV